MKSLFVCSVVTAKTLFISGNVGLDYQQNVIICPMAQNPIFQFLQAEQMEHK